MAVTATVIPQFFPIEGGRPDPRLPLGRWLASVTVTGDASGGEATLIVRFADTDQRNINIPVYSIFDLAAWREDGTAQNAELQINRFSLKLGGDTSVQNRNYLLSGALANSKSIYAFEQHLPLFLGHPTPTASVASDVRVTFGSNTNTVVYVFFAQGFYWAYDSNYMPGGVLNDPGRIVSEIPVPGGQSFYSRLRAGVR